MVSRPLLLVASLCLATITAGCQTAPPAPYGELHDKVANGEMVPVADLRASFRRDVALPERMERLMELEAQALQRQGTIHDLAKAMLFICSDEASR